MRPRPGRNPLPQALCRRTRSACRNRFLDCLLQWPAPAPHCPSPAPGACFAGPHSPWPPPLAPPAPRRIAALRSSASQLLWRSMTSPVSPSPATAPRLPDAIRRRERPGWTRDLPVPAQRAMPGSKTTSGRAQGSRRPVLPSDAGTSSALGITCLSRLNGWPTPPPCRLLRRQSCDRQRTARGRCGSLLLHRRGLTWAFPGQVVRFVGTSNNTGGCFGIQGLSPIS
jgi:hypothetical protein